MRGSDLTIGKKCSEVLDLYERSSNAALKMQALRENAYLVGLTSDNEWKAIKEGLTFYSDIWRASLG